MRFRRAGVVVLATTVAIVIVIGVPALAHEMTVMGTVAAIESGRIQVKTGKEKTGDAPAWYPIDDKTKIRRGTKAVSLSEARIKVDERVVLIVDHPEKGPIKTKEIRLAAQ